MDGAYQVLFVDMMAALMPAFEPETSPTEILVTITRSTMVAMRELGFAYRFFLEYMLHKSRTGESLELGEFLQKVDRDQVRTGRQNLSKLDVCRTELFEGHPQSLRPGELFDLDRLFFGYQL